MREAGVVARRFTATSEGEAHVVTVVHDRVRGRTRFEVLHLYRNPAFAEQLEVSLRAVPGILSVSANPLTGRVLIRYDSLAHSASRLHALILRLVPTTIGAGRRPQPTTGGPRYLRSGPPPVARAPSPRHAASATTVAPPRRATVWQTMTIAEAVAHWQAQPETGLTSAEAVRRLKRHGPNRLPTLGARSNLSIFLEQLMTVPVALLGVSAGISVATGGFVDAVVIAAVVLINAGIGFVTERQSERMILALADDRPRSVVALRDGERQEIPIEQVVPGDTLLLAPGAYVAADLRLVEAHRLTIDESSMTGESVPVTKHAGRTFAVETPLGDRHNLAFMGSVVTGGSGVGVVVATGPDTEIGRIQAMAGEARPPETPLQRQLGEMGTQLAMISGLVCAGIFALGLVRGIGWLPMLKSAVSLAVAAVPEGLPAMATTTLALGIQRMRKLNAAVRRLGAVEALGSIQVLCLDKTGTLTHNRMTAVAVKAGRAHFDAVALRGRAAGCETADLDRGADELCGLLRVVALCNEVEIARDDRNGEPRLAGSPTEVALVELARGAGIDLVVLRARHPLVKLSPRAEDRPYMISVHATPDGLRWVAVKGSPARVLELCSREMVDGVVRPLEAAAREYWTLENERMAGDALRVLGVAYGEPATEDAAPEDLVWLGLVGMTDPLREGMPELIRQYHAAGIDTVMITGDQSATAYAIGRALGLSRDESLRILDSAHLENLTPEATAALARDLHVFARVSPAHKLRIVQALQRAGKVVAMTGDGVNDGPALKAADVGIAMGRGGSDVARSVADVVIEDDNLHTMITAIEQGRSIYDNIRKTLRFLLSTNFTEIEVMLIGIAAGQGELLNPMQLLWINLISDIFPGLALAMEPAEAGIMQRPPRDPREPIIRPADLRRIGAESSVMAACTLAGFAYARARYGPGARANTIAFTTVAVAELLHALVCRSSRPSVLTLHRPQRNPYLTLALGGSLAAQALLLAVPALRRIVGTVPLGMEDLLVVGIGSLAPLLVNDTLKLVWASDADGAGVAPVVNARVGSMPTDGVKSS